MFNHAIALFSGLLFGLGMMISGMVNPANVIGFLDIFGQWNPNLAFVMGGALLVFMPGYFFLVRKQAKPLLADTFCVNESTALDAKLISGAALFGVGWGLVGICPGPAITALGSGSSIVFLFVLSAVIGMYFVNVITTKPSPSSLPAHH
ncbi:YeeE/YedE family protein [Enterovibrio sp. ZSDZ42]|uniref:YeeE/YedE family protein n=1 Tax=Enterovibrio gelatinilyticus TaxID=2899819 RepID=A0ABT5R310_9GAMM|nr:YeeE/YedE family protein [Enterovibrio sp. ZSDZ42]MDD1794658.1 YeeE/YedE family protein [Enterovibrio sp. ZSDZ42]